MYFAVEKKKKINKKKKLVLQSVGDQHISEVTVIRFRCSSARIEKFGEFFFWEMKCHPACPFSIARSLQGRQAKRSGCSSCSSSCGGGRSAERGGWEEKVEVKEDRGESRG
jgi:hypothetical protein